MDLKLTNNDLDITNNELTLITGIDETSQNITVNLKTILGEWFLDEAIGVPWLNEIFVKRNSLSQAQAILIDNIRQTNGVKKINDLTFDFNNSTRQLSVSTRIQSEDGDIILNDIVPVE